MRLPFPLDARIVEPLQPEDHPLPDGVPPWANKVHVNGAPRTWGVNGDSPIVVSSAPVGGVAREETESDQEVEARSEAGVRYQQWKDECKAIQDQIDSSYERYIQARDSAKVEIQRIEANVRSLHEDWLRLRTTPKPPQPVSERRRKK